MVNVIVISHSEVESFLSCQMKHFYAFIDSTYGPNAGLEPMTFSDSLFRGIAGHEALGKFYNLIREGNSVEVAGEAAIQHLRVIGIRPEVFSNPRHLNIITDLASRILPRFFAYEAVQNLDRGWFPEYAEHTFRLRLEFEEATYVYPFTPDVIMKDAVGNLWVWDHKFVYNFYNNGEIKLLPQIPKYIGALRAGEGMHVKGGHYNMLRWREVKDETKHVMQEKFVPNDARVQNAFRQQYNVMVEIGARKQMPAEEAQAKATRVLSTMVCKSCSFKDLCAADLEGLDTTLMKRTQFRQNSYGYSEKGSDD